MRKVWYGLSTIPPPLSVEELIEGDDAELRGDEFGYFCAGWSPSFVEADGELQRDRSALSFGQRFKEIGVSVADVGWWTSLGCHEISHVPVVAIIGIRRWTWCGRSGGRGFGAVFSG